MRLNTFARLTRIEHSIMLALATVIGEIVVMGGVPPTNFLILTAMVPFFIGLASFSLNDLLDIGSDRINKRRDRPLVSGDASRNEAFDIAVIGFIIGNALAYLISWEIFLIALAFSLLAIIYNVKLKDFPLAGNVYISTTMAIPFIFGSVAVAGIISSNIAILSAMAFTVGLARELMKTASDVKGDRIARKAQTLPMVIGIRNTLLLSSLLYVLAIVLSYFPFVSPGPYEGNLAYAVPIVLADALFAFSAYNSLSGEGKFLRRARNISLLALGIGLLGFLAGILL